MAPQIKVNYYTTKQISKHLELADKLDFTGLNEITFACGKEWLSSTTIHAQEQEIWKSQCNTLLQINRECLKKFNYSVIDDASVIFGEMIKCSGLRELTLIAVNLMPEQLIEISNVLLNLKLLDISNNQNLSKESIMSATTLVHLDTLLMYDTYNVDDTVLECCILLSAVDIGRTEVTERGLKKFVTENKLLETLMIENINVDIPAILQISMILEDRKQKTTIWADRDVCVGINTENQLLHVEVQHDYNCTP